MNREIKFRGFWYSLNGKINSVVGDLTVIRNRDKSHFYPKGSKDGDCYISNQYGGAYAYQVIPESAGQFTGQYDKNGKEIYEGDMLSHEDDDGICIEEVLWDNENACFCLKDLLDCETLPFDEYFIDEFIVSGNIHENSELLKGELK